MSMSKQDFVALADAIREHNRYEGDKFTDDQLNTLAMEDVENLLIHKDFKKQCTKLSKERDDAKKAFIRSIKELSKSSKSLENLEKEISSAFTPKEDRFFEAIGRIKEKVIKQKEELFSDVQYDDIFSEEVVKFLSEPDVKKDIESYIRTYNQLLDKSTYFKRGIFNFYSAETIADALEKHGWFKAEHTVNLRERKIENKKQLIELIEGEKKGIFSNEELRAKWEVINKKIMQKTGLRAFYDYITRNEHLLAHLSDLREFKENTFISYFTTNKDAFSSLIGLHERIEKEIEKLQSFVADRIAHSCGIGGWITSPGSVGRMGARSRHQNKG